MWLVTQGQKVAKRNLGTGERKGHDAERPKKIGADPRKDGLAGLVMWRTIIVCRDTYQDGQQDDRKAENR